MSCPICVHAVEHGSWPVSMRGTHCGFDGGCHRTWAGKRESHCPECHAHFSADSVAEKHRVKDRCMSREEMLETRSKAGEPVFRLFRSDMGEIWRHGASLRLKPAWMQADGIRGDG